MDRKDRSAGNTSHRAVLISLYSDRGYFSVNLTGPQGSHSGAAADAQGSAADGSAAALHFIQHGDDDPQAGAADGVAQGDTGTVGVGLVHVDRPAVLFLQLHADTQELCSESLVDLPVVHVVEVHVSTLQALGDGVSGANAHVLGLDAGRAHVDHLGHGLQAQFLGLVGGHHDHSSSSVVDTGSVGGGGDTVGSEDGLHLGQRLIVAAADGVLVGVDDDVALLLVMDNDGNDLVLELALVDGGAGAVVADDGQLVALLTGHAAQLCHVISGHAHVAGDQSVIQSVVDQAVIQLCAALGGDAAHTIAHTSLGEHEGSLGHVLGADDQADLGLAQLDVAAGDLQSTHTGSAVLVDGHGAALNGQTDPHGDLTCGQRTLHAEIALTHDDLVDGVNVDACAANGFLTSGNCQLSGGDILELALELTDGGTTGADNNYIFGLHLRYPPVLSYIWSFYTKMH